ncbi:MAG: hypothetical protein RIS64_1361 [Bacteroidota bacterium]
MDKSSRRCKRKGWGQLNHKTYYFIQKDVKRNGQLKHKTYYLDVLKFFNIGFQCSLIPTRSVRLFLQTHRAIVNIECNYKKLIFNILINPQPKYNLCFLSPYVFKKNHFVLTSKAFIAPPFTPTKIIFLPPIFKLPINRLFSDTENPLSHPKID